ncbi:FAD-dependent oxidoreductase [Streptomyces sp. WAC06614]|uniref:FAD-dependent oxidoreductase n=1 Tax=Streptomyces sp. WAC06614 TaxID=2487416 RepID=UPI000F76AA87|nr:FAD-dependent oxidoreductase [Streptomyces sp. WAC06614]RSS84126.1 FAD-dependent oxidoreductase [Streptomyces sp. WAC06614]
MRSYWMDSTADAPAHPPLDGDRTADVVVVGAGITGLCAARELVLAGREVLVLEAGQVGGGVSGHTTGKLTALHGLRYAQLTAEHGPEAAALYARSQEEALRHVLALCGELGIDAEAERLPAYTWTSDEERAGEFLAEAEAARTAGLDARYVTETGLPFPVAGAVRVEDQLQFHPRRFLLGLAHDLVGRGAAVHEGTRVTGLRERADCRLTLAGGGTVHARDVVLATHYPLDCHASLMARLTVLRELVVAAPVAAHEVPEGMYLTPEEGVRSVRSAPYGDGRRLLIVTGESFVPGTDDAAGRWARLADWAHGHLPGFPGGRPPYRWAAQDVHSVDHLPYVGHEHPDTQHVFLGTGYGGWGLSHGVMAGRLLAAHVTGRPRPAWTELFDPRRTLPLREVGDVAREQVSVARHYAAGFGPGPRCTHMGCELGFNEAEDTWECPCHGSRFAASDGRVLQGPATRPLDVPGG